MDTMAADRRGAWIAGGLSFLLYALTLAPGVTWGDSAKLVLMTLPLDPGITPGEHHLRNLLGAVVHALVPWGDPAWRQNLSSAVCGAGAVGLVYALTRRLTARGGAAAVAAAALAVSHTFWHLAVIAESYALATLLFAGQAWYALGWAESGEARRLRGFALLTGLALANHVLTLVLMGPFAVLFAWAIWRKRPERPGAAEVARWVGLFLLGYAPVLYAVARHLPEHGLWACIDGVLDLEATQYLKARPGLNLRGVAQRGLAIAAQAPGLAGVLALAGAAVARRRPAFLVLGGAMTLGLWAFASLHLDQRAPYRLVPAYWCLAVFAGFGWRAVEERWLGAVGTAPPSSKRAPVALAAALVLTLVVPPLVYAASPGIVRRLGIELGAMHRLRDLTYRDSLRYFLVPWKRGDDGPERFARDALAQAGPDGVVVADFTLLTVLNYGQQILGLAPGVRVESLESDRVRRRGLDALAHEMRGAGRRTYVVDDHDAYRLDRLERHRVERAGILWEIVPR